jgi:hypothetical protein
MVCGISADGQCCVGHKFYRPTPFPETVGHLCRWVVPLDVNLL